MGKSNGLKQRLKQAAKRRSRRHSADGVAATRVENRGVGGDTSRPTDASASPPQQAVLDAFVAVLLDYDRRRQAVCDREVLAALKGLQRGYPSNEPIVVELHGRLTQLKAEARWETYPIRRATEQLIELLRSYEDGRRDSRAGVDYLHSIAN
jgi:hypothetical protein